MSITAKYFEKRLATATSVVVCGISIGIFTLPYLVRYLLDEYTLRGASLILAGLMSNCYVCAALMKPLPKTVKLDYRPSGGNTRTQLSEVTVQQDSFKSTISQRLVAVFTRFAIMQRNDAKQKPKLSQIFAVTLFKDPIFALFFVFSLVVYFSNECILQLYPAILKDLHLTHYHSAILLSLTGLTGLFGRIVSGCLGDYITHRYRVVLLSQPVIGLAVILNQFAVKFWSQVIYALTFGLFYGIPYVYRIALMKDFFHSSDLTKMIGLTGFASGVGSACGFPLIGWLRDHSGRYLVPLYVIGVLYLLNAFILLSMRLLQGLSNRKPFAGIV